MFAVTKDPQADLDYQIDWTAWLGADTIATSTWTTGGGLVAHDATIDADAKKVTVWLSGGTASAQPARVTNRITTAGGRSDDRSISVTIQQR